MEARVGIEPTIEDLQSSALPLGDRAISNQCGEKEAGCGQDQAYSAQKVILSIWIVCERDFLILKYTPHP